MLVLDYKCPYCGFIAEENNIDPGAGHWEQGTDQFLCGKCGEVFRVTDAESRRDAAIWDVAFERRSKQQDAAVPV